MGALHQGHISLVEAAARACSKVVVSIYVNPTQFNDPRDFERYPRTEANDLAMLSDAGVHAVFLPETREMYPNPNERLEFDFNGLDTVMEGAHRPGHFLGVVTIVDTLFKAVVPDRAFFGQKDFQQLAIIRLLAKRLHPYITVVGCPIVREADGLAMSSRNRLLDAESRQKAPAIFRCLESIRQNWKVLGPETLIRNGLDILAEAGLETEYLEIADAASLQGHVTGNDAVACVAVRTGGIRLIDNVLLPA
jgi:pantoate--beta-alanine ligase